MIHTVIKRDGTKEPFDPEKLNRWGQYAAKTGGDWSTVVMNTVKRLPSVVSSEDIHQTMIDVCIELESIEYSRLAARLQFATLRKNLSGLGVSDKGSFKDIYEALCVHGVWNKDSLPEYDPVWEDWYSQLYELRLEYWQVKQFDDKYGLKYKGKVVETPHVAMLGLALAHHGTTQLAFDTALAILQGKLNLPTPALNGGRNGDFDSVSCCVITGGDTVDSIGVAEHIAYKMTAKKAGIGIEFQTRSKGTPVKGGRVAHLGKHGIYATVDKAVKMFSQVTRGGSATVTYTAIDPQIMEMLLWKTQKIDIEQRIDKLDYSMAYNDAFIEAVVNDSDWYLFDYLLVPEMHEAFYTSSAEDYRSLVDKYKHLASGSVKAQDLLKRFLTSRQETGRVYCLNVTRANTHTPFLDKVYLSNLCQEIMLPTKPYLGMDDLYSNEQSIGETAFCSLAAINVGKVDQDLEEYPRLAEVALRTVDSMISKTSAMTRSMYNSMQSRRSVGIGITGLAQYLYKLGTDYTGDDYSLSAVSKLAEMHYHSLLSASQEMVRDGTCKPVSGININWLPIDTSLNKYLPELDWERLRGVDRGHSVLVAHMPTESSAVFSGATNGLYPPRDKIIYKQSRKGTVQFILDNDNFIPFWDVNNITMSKYYSRVQDFTDQGISADYTVVPEKFPNGKVPLSQLMKEWIAQAKLGNKTMYYTNTKPNKTVSVQDLIASKEVEEEACQGGCKI